MELTDYIDVYNATAHKCKLGMDETGEQLTDGAEFAALRVFHSQRLARIWHRQLWPDLVRSEKRYFRDLWNAATNYVASTLTVPVEVFYPGPNKYYQALAASTNQPPATLSGGTWTTNLTYWAECARTNTAAVVYDATVAYVRGNQVYYPNTDRVYQLHAATSTGDLPTDTTKWGVLTDFDVYIAFAQTGRTAWEHAFSVWDRDPKIHRHAERLQTAISSNGIQVFTNYPWGWLRYRVTCPRLTGNVLDPEAIYAAGRQVYYASATLRGNFYNVVTTTTAGETPDSAAAKFSKVELPRMFERYLVHGGAADYLKPEDPGEGMAEEQQATEAESELTMLYLGQMGTGAQVEYSTR